MRLMLALFSVLPVMAHAARITAVTYEALLEGQNTNEETVHIDLLADQDERAFQVVVRAFVVEGEDNSKLAPVHRLNPEKPAQKGGEIYVDSSVVETPAALPGVPVSWVRKSVKVPLYAFLLPNGPAVRLGFVATLASLDFKVKFDEAASALQTISVDGKTRLVAARPKPEPQEAVSLKPEVIETENGKVKVNTVVDATITAFPTKQAPKSVTLEKRNDELKKQTKDDPAALAEGRVHAQAAGTDNLVYFATNRKMSAIQGRPNQYKFFAVPRAKGEAGLSWGVCPVDLATREQEQSWWSSSKAKVVEVTRKTESAFL